MLMKKTGKPPLLELHIIAGKQTIRKVDYFCQDRCYGKQNGSGVDSDEKVEG